MSASKVVFNTAITYSRAILTSLISLYATRVVLKELGAEDYGLFNVVGGLAATLSFLNAAMTTSTQRYLSHSLGLKNSSRVKKIFANSVIVHFFLGLIFIVFVELVGNYFINNQLKIDVNRIQEAKYIFHFVVFSTYITIISVPYEALIVSKENFTLLAVVSIIQSLLKLLTAMSLLFLKGDLLIYYGFFTMLSAIIVRIIKRILTRKIYNESHVNYKAEYDITQIKELLSFASWNLFGTLCGILRSQGIGILINLFYTTFVNAAYAIANQLNSQLMFFSSSLISSMRPQIVKSEGANDRERTIRLALIANKFAFYLFSFFAVPVFFKMPFFLEIWLDQVPRYTIIFCRLVIILTVLLQLNLGLMAAVQAIGKIKYYQIIAGSIQLLVLPIGFIFLYFDFEPYYILIGAICLELMATIFRIFYFNYLTGFSKLKYIKNVIILPWLTLAPLLIILTVTKDFYSNDLLGFVLFVFSSASIYVILIHLIGITSLERDIINSIFKKIQKKIYR